MLTLAFDTATESLSVAVLMEEEPLAEVTLFSRVRHGETLLVTIQNLLHLTGNSIEAVKLVACTVGPGSFTGLRIGLATAQGLAQALKVPAVGVSTLAALAYGQPGGAAFVCPLLDAGKDQVYGAVYKTTADPARSEIIPAQARPIEDMIAITPEPALFIGSGARRHRVLIEQMKGDSAFFSVMSGNYLGAAAVGLLGLSDWRNGKPCGHLTPVYLRSTVKTAPG